MFRFCILLFSIILDVVILVLDLFFHWFVFFIHYLVVTGRNGCTHMNTNHTVQIIFCPEHWLISVFSPSADGIHSTGCSCTQQTVHIHKKDYSWLFSLALIHWSKLTNYNIEIESVRSIYIHLLRILFFSTSTFFFNNIWPMKSNKLVAFHCFKSHVRWAQSGRCPFADSFKTMEFQNEAHTLKICSYLDSYYMFDVNDVCPSFAILNFYFVSLFIWNWSCHSFVTHIITMCIFMIMTINYGREKCYSRKSFSMKLTYYKSYTNPIG